MNYRITKLRESFDANNIEAFIISKPENVAYLSLFTGSSGTLLITHNKKYLFTDFRYIEQASMQAPEYEIIDFSEKGLLKEIQDICRDETITKVGFEGHYLTYVQVQEILKELNSLHCISITNTVETLRLIKDANEIKKIQKAESIGDTTFKHILSYIKIGMTEKEIALELEMHMKKLGASKLSFDTIVASGENSSKPHAQPTDRRIKKGDFLKMDFGCVYEDYCSDMTRTIVIGEASEKHKEIYNIVLEAQMKAIATVKAGVKAKEIDAIARDYIKSKGYGENFGHGLGHGLGRYIHEDPRVSPKGDIVLQPGMVITIEPGIYIPSFGGVRIEDVVVVTEEGCNNLTNSPKELIVL